MSKLITDASLDEKRLLLANLLKQEGKQRHYFPASFAQERMWFLTQLEPDNPFYNVPAAVRLSGPLHLEVLEQSLNEIIRRHEALRTNFTMVNGQLVQVIAQSLRISLSVVDVRDQPPEAREAAIEAFARQEALYPFNLATDLLLRVSLGRLADEEHVLLLTMHHIISDAWSIGVFLRELGLLYESLSVGRSVVLPELTIQYTDFAHWQRQYLQGEAYDRQLAYWKEKLADAPPVLDLPTDRPRPAMQSFRGAALSFALPLRLSGALRELSLKQDATLFMTLLAGFKVLLWRYTGQDDVVLGTPVANRNRKEIEPLIGFFVNSLALRTQLSGRLSFTDLLARVREVALGAYAHQDFPFEELVEQLQPHRDLRWNPIFQVMFSLQNAPMPALELAGLKLESVPINSETAKFDLILSLAESAQGLGGAVEYNTDLFDRQTIDRLVGHYQHLLEAVTANPQQRLADLPLLTDAEHQQILWTWNDTARDYPQDCGVHELFEAQAERNPTALAVVYPDQAITYGELNQRANQLAHYLRQLGVGPDVPVILLVERSVEMVVAQLGILKAGGVYVPLDPSYPKERLEFMIENAGAKVLLTQQDLMPLLPAHDLAVCCLDRDWQEIAQGATDNPVSAVGPDNLAYIIYTSGSTGKPKGISIPHRAISRLVMNTDYIALGPGDRIAQAANASFDAATFEIWGALLTGAQIVGVPTDIALSPSQFAAYIRQQRITTLFLTTALFNQLAQEVPEAFRPLTHLLFGGEAVDVRRVERVLAHGKPERLLHVYGPTESTTFASWHLIEAVAAEANTIPIGRPIANTRLYVLDGLLQAVPVGVPGELYIGGDGLARDYWQRPELTAERFIPDPLSGVAGARLYKTGDVVRYRAGGEIEFIGRVDHQVKLRGFRIELGEIEAALQEYAGVREAVVVAREEQGGDKRLVGYIIAEAGEAVAAGELRRFLRQRLPAYMVPSAFVQLERLPLTPNGKVDRRALPVPEPAKPELEESYVAPQTVDQEVIAGILAELLAVERVGLHDNFFELGGHSLLATQAVSRLREAFKVEIPLRRLFESPTVAGLAEFVASTAQAEPGLEAPPITKAPRDQQLLLSYAQQRLWMINQLVPDTPAYNLPFAVRLEGELDEAALGRSLQEVVRRHEALRTTFQPHGDSVVQVISEAGHLELVVEEVNGKSETERQEWVQRRGEEMGREVMDLKTGPLVRVRLLRESASSHVLVVVMHHIVSDGWSMGVLIQEMAALYAAYSAGRESPLADLAIQYADFAQWQRQWLSGDVLDEQMGYWKEQLAGLPVLEMPTDRPRPALQTFVGSYQTMQLPAALVARLKELSQAEGATLFMTLLAGFKVLLWRYSGQADVVVGSPIANRNRKEIEPLIGFFVNTLVLRTDMRGAGSFREVLGRVREVALGAYAHQDVPFEKLVEELQPQRDLSRNPLFQAMFALQNTPQPELKLSGLNLNLLPLDQKTTLFDLTLSLWDGEAVSGFLSYNTALFDSDTMARLVERFEMLLWHIAADPDQRLGDLSLLSAVEQGHLLEAWEDSRQDFPANRCIHEWFEAQAERTPYAVAISNDGEQLNYQELNGRANQLAHYLQSLGVGPETAVAICTVRSLDLIVGILGILKAGGAYVPLEPAFPKERLLFMLEDTQAPVLLTHQELTAHMPELACKVVCLDTDWFEIAGYSDENPSGGVEADNLAYLIYTSGSTGRPKGVQLQHRGLVNLVAWHCRTYAVTEADRATLLAGLSFDASVWELWPYLVAGASLHIAEEETRATPAKLMQWFAAEGITLTFLPTPLAEAVLEEPLPEGLALRAMLTGGDKLRRAPRSALPFELVNHYGPAENTVVSTWSVVASGSDRPPAIGKPIDNTSVYVLNADLQPVPCDIPGELYISSVGLARGYHGHADLTADRFIPNPFGSEAGARLYRSGDLVRRRADGELEFLGRVDNQVKIRGFRIELGEIEAVLCEHADVREAIVLVREDRPGEKRLVAYVVPVQQPGPTTNDLRNFLREKLPAFMVPSYYVLLEGLPITPNGKIDYRGLPAPDRSRSDLQSAYVAPRSPLEQTLASMWADLLAVEQVGIHDNFFELGGHSLLATQVVSRVRDTFQIELPLRNLFESPTIAELAMVIEALSGGDQKLLAPAIAPVARDINLPLSFAQQRLWFIDQFESGSPAYNMHFAVRYVGDLQVAALERSLNEIIRRHEVLRTTFAIIDGQPFQLSLPEFHLRLARVDLRDVPSDTRMNDVQRLASEELLKPFDLARDLMMRATLYQVEDEEYVLLLIIHHIASDGWSMGILTQELTRLYGAFASDQPSPLAPLPIQYADYAYWQRQWLQGEVLESQMGYWREQLADAPPVLELPTDRPRPAIQTFRGAKHVLIIPEALSDKAKALSQREGMTLFMTLLAAFKALLHRYTGQSDIVVGTPIAGRTRGETEPLIGFFINTLVLRTDLTNDPTVRECLSRVRVTSVDAYAHQDVPFEKLVEELQPQRDVRYTPLFQVMFALQNAPLPDLELPGLSLSPLQIESGKSLFDLTLSLLEGPEGIIGTFEYNTDLFNAETIARMEEHYKRILEAMTNDPEQRLSALPLLTPTEEQQILRQWNDTRTDYEADQCIQNLFEAQVERTPEAVAVIFGNDQLTYRELNRLANQLAHYLKAQGVRPEQPIGLLVERSREMIIGMLGILKAGGVYLPLDPTYPKERLAFMLNDARVPLLLTQQRLLQTLPEHDAQVICLDGDWPVIADETDHNPNRRATADQLAYVMYTSGSTGWPKGVSITHRNVARLVRQTDYARLAADEVILQLAPISFDASTFEIWGSLLNGGQLVIMPPHLPSLEELGQALRQYRVSTLWLTAGLFHLMVDERLDDLQTVRQLLAGGDVLSVTHVRAALERLQGTRLINGYGPTESTTFACCYHIASLDQDHRAVPIGRPIANTQTFILDEHLQPVPVGVRGELYLGGDGLARGYWNQPALTATTFMPNPFAANPGERLYKTGDLARYRADGNLEFLGRLDQQVKLRGFRIELGEIETVLSEHRAVREAVVLVREEQPGDKRLVAYIMSDEEPAPTAGELRGYLEGKLPEFMMPSVFVILDNLPLTANGKVDRAALADAKQTPVATAELMLAPRNELEQELTRIWEEVLGIHPVGVRDNFFEIGGHSLLAVRLISRIEQRFGKKLPLASLFQSPTVEHLAQLLHHQVETSCESALVPIQPGGSRRPLYLVHAAAGTVFCYAELSRHLGSEQPVYGLQAPALDGQRNEFSEIEAMATHYNEAIRAMQPEGPYRIGGWSMGGLVAYEMARQLESQGHSVELLALFDSAPISKEEAPPPVDDVFVLMNFAHDLGLPIDQVARWVESLEHMETDDRLGYILEKAQGAGIVPEDLDIAQLRRFLDIFKTNVRAMHQYAPKPYAGRLVLFKAAEMVGPQKRQSRLGQLARRFGARRKPIDAQQDDPSLGWASLTSGAVAIQPVPGNHYTMMRAPHIVALGEALGTHLHDL